MYILAMETTGPNASAALLRAAEPGSAPEPEIIERAVLLGQQTSYEAKNHLKNLMPLIQKLLTTCGVEKSQLTHIAVSVGPGSFTGIRIGVSTARALAQALQLPCIAVPTLEVFCHAQAAKHAHTRAQGAQDEAVRAIGGGAQVVAASSMPDADRSTASSTAICGRSVYAHRCARCDHAAGTPGRETGPVLW